MLRNLAGTVLHKVRMLVPRRIKASLRPVFARPLSRVLRPAETKIVVEWPPCRIQPTKTPITHVSVVIPTKNAGALFAEVMEKIRGQDSCYPIDITIVDSGSTDETVAIARKYGANVIAIDPGQFNHGLTRNLAIENTSGEIIVLLTQDAVP